MNYAKYFLLSLIALWLFGFLYVFNNNRSNSNSSISKQADDYMGDANNDVKQRLYGKTLIEIENEIKKLESKNRHNEILIKTLQENSKALLESKPAEVEINQKETRKKFEFEEMRRKIYADLKDISYYLNSELEDLSKKNPTLKLDNLHGNFKTRISLLLAEFYNMSISDNLGEWRRSASLSLGAKVQKKLKELQNPSDCDSSPLLICDLNKACGFGCQMHHIMYCFITAFFTKRTMILESFQWRYNQQGYEAYFQPISNTCTSSKNTKDAVGWNEADESNKKIPIRMPIIDVVANKPKFFPLSVPSEYENELKKFHGNPFTWWAGQILSYLMRFNQNFSNVLKEKSTKLGFKKNCVGVHVRRTDKVGTEAAYHHLAEYMKEVEQYYAIDDFIHAKNSSNSDESRQKCVYLATDEITVIKEATTKYTNFKFIYDESNAKSASVNQRYSPDSAQGVILDIYFLSQCDFLVCTFSSQVCRLAYELMQTRFPDASWRFRSLDDVYYFGGQNGHVAEALFNHVPLREKGEIELKVGDKIYIAGNHWNGYSKGLNSRTNENGLFPSFKVKDLIQVY